MRRRPKTSLDFLDLGVKQIAQEDPIEATFLWFAVWQHREQKWNEAVAKLKDLNGDKQSR